jgi:deferrochelatase/peroxidase EfeB
VAQIRWVQTGFLPTGGGNGTPRNLMGFLDGTNNPSVHEARTMEKIIWVGNEGPDWMQGGSYVVARRIRIALEHWDRMTVEVQEKAVGRHKCSGAPLGKQREHDPLDLSATDKDGNPIIPDSAHARLASAEANDGAGIATPIFL